MKSFLVIGLGRFGAAAAEKLYDQGNEVLIIDQDEELVRHVADKSTHAVIGDAQDMAVLKAAGAKECDCAIVAIGEDLAASVVITMNLKDLGTPYIVCKAHDETYKRALERVGADRVLIPEKEIAVRLVQSLGTSTFLDYIEFSDEYGIVELSPPKSWRGKTLRELSVRSHHQATVLAIRSRDDGSVRMLPGAEDVIHANDTVMMMGRNDDLKELQKL